MAKTAHTSAFLLNLQEGTEARPGRKKSDRTLARIRLATAHCLERSGYNSLKASAISLEAGLSEGSFYVYFEDKNQAAISVLSDFLQYGIGSPHERGRASNAFEAIRATNRVWIQTAVEHPGLTRSVLQLVDSDAEFAKIYTSHNKRWHEMVSGSVLRRYPSGYDNSDLSIMFAVVAMGAMMDEVVRGIFSTGTYAHLLHLVGHDKTGRQLADALSVIWFRVLYPGAELPQEKGRQPYLMSELDGTLAELNFGSLTKASVAARAK
ncbi:MAG: TetR/AcrR family transcriptional regulator [Pseudomonadota bacterium]